MTQIAVINTNGSNLRTWAGGYCGGWWCAMPGWSPDAHRIAYTDGKGISVINADNDDSLVRLTRTGAIDSEPTWAPSGTRIAFARAYWLAKPYLFKPWPPPHASSEIYVMNADGTGVTRLTHNHIADTSPAWQPVATS